MAETEPHLLSFMFVNAQLLPYHSLHLPHPHITPCCCFTRQAQNMPFWALMLSLGNPHAGPLTLLFTTVAGPCDSKPPTYPPLYPPPNPFQPLALSSGCEVPNPSPPPFVIPLLPLTLLFTTAVGPHNHNLPAHILFTHLRVLALSFGHEVPNPSPCPLKPLSWPLHPLVYHPIKSPWPQPTVMIPGKYISKL